MQRGIGVESSHGIFETYAAAVSLIRVHFEYYTPRWRFKSSALCVVLFVPSCLCSSRLFREKVGF